MPTFRKIKASDLIIVQATLELNQQQFSLTKIMSQIEVKHQ